MNDKEKESKGQQPPKKSQGIRAKICVLELSLQNHLNRLLNLCIFKFLNQFCGTNKLT